MLFYSLNFISFPRLLTAYNDYNVFLPYGSAVLWNWSRPLLLEPESEKGGGSGSLFIMRRFLKKYIP